MHYMIAFNETDEQFKERTDLAKSQAHLGGLGRILT